MFVEVTTATFVKGDAAQRGMQACRGPYPNMLAFLSEPLFAHSGRRHLLRASISGATRATPPIYIALHRIRHISCAAKPLMFVEVTTATFVKGDAAQRGMQACRGPYPNMLAFLSEPLFAHSGRRHLLRASISGATRATPPIYIALHRIRHISCAAKPLMCVNARGRSGQKITIALSSLRRSMSIMIFALAPSGVRVVCAAAVGVAPKSLPRQHQRTQHACGALFRRAARPSAPPTVGAPYVAVSATRPRGRAQYAVLLSFFLLSFISLYLCFRFLRKNIAQ